MLFPFAHHSYSKRSVLKCIPLLKKQIKPPLKINQQNFKNHAIHEIKLKIKVGGSRGSSTFTQLTQVPPSVSEMSRGQQVSPECRARSNLRAPLGVAPKHTKTTTKRLTKRPPKIIGSIRIHSNFQSHGSPEVRYSYIFPSK